MPPPLSRREQNARWLDHYTDVQLRRIEQKTAPSLEAVAQRRREALHAVYEDMAGEEVLGGVIYAGGAGSLQRIQPVTTGVHISAHVRGEK